jgi:tripartite-type tricarboxylate transporter receptor subunit TctC
MKTSLAILTGSVAAAIIGSAAVAQDYPERDLSYIVPFNAGGQTDIASRVLAEQLSEVLGVSATVVNRGGAGGSVGTAELAAADPDGYTIGTTTSTPLIQTPNRTKTPYGIDSFQYICRVYDNPAILVVSKDSEYESFEQLIEAAQSGERITYGSVGSGSVQHIAGIQLQQEFDFEAVQVQAPNDTDNVRNLLAGVIDVYLVAGSVFRQNADMVRPLTVLGNKRLGVVPDTPTIFELDGTVRAGVWGALVTPAGVPQERVEALREACATAQESDAFIETLTGFGMEPVYMNGPDTEALAREQFKAAGIILEELGLVQE